MTVIEQAKALIKAVYNFHEAGGLLHIVIDDHNLDDASVEFCLKAIGKQLAAGTEEFTHNQLITQMVLGVILYALDEEQREEVMVIENAN